MRPASNSTAAATGAVFRHWNSPIPYLFGGIAAMLGLIAIALVILACSFRESSRSSNDEAEEKPAKPTVDAMQLEMEPKIVVIMAGDENPTYIANPTRHHDLQV
ncbi:hypothetical protein E1A91_A07G200500v1 [Gossypium mustelinum]|uniref:Protein GLUTAMINE DUMPER 4 n=4 Tax=Gossypium TaxID=3633 RepID=A0A2P5YTY4_GOSBA|nr:hypothetical protein ES319_A07G192800v1 [Gossypium barbadense]PPS19058.1 hypothetical protein GOBAR_AA01517 [Gossypium barbadense]TYH10843.1 hypothetical protein ES288_A07G209500v1 [Gossypium darwinii]TYI20045.1 hypothetical protein ES332_A07G207300v1 [Gossypium tomentosum]TYJ27631.1 hypothetical protein E1A91_A07G200500v1 [Gossypium mustelinum]